jgi:hypothetical protein
VLKGSIFSFQAFKETNTPSFFSLKYVVLEMIVLDTGLCVGRGGPDQIFKLLYLFQLPIPLLIKQQLQIQHSLLYSYITFLYYQHYTIIQELKVPTLTFLNQDPELHYQGIVLVLRAFVTLGSLSPHGPQFDK